MKTDNSLASTSIPALDDEQVADYLRKRPDFFKQHENLLVSLDIPHKRGTAVSLLERQVSLLRASNEEYQGKIDSFIIHAQENDELFEKTRFIILEIIKSHSLQELSSVIEDKLRKDFSATSSLLVFVTDEAIPADAEGTLNLLPLEKARASLGDLFERKRTYCGSLAAEQTAFLFSGQGKSIVSAAVVPIHLSEENDIRKRSPGIPLLLIGSDKANHFNSKLDTLFLDFIGEVLAVHMNQLLAPGKTS